MSKFNFNMMDSAGYGFYRVWTERAYLLKLATIPLVIKFACMMAVIMLDLNNNMLRQGLILLPGILAEGWVLSQFLRTMLKGERWPTILPADIDDSMLDKLLMRARGIVAATLAYALVAMMGYLIRYFMFGTLMGDFNAGQDDVARLLEASEEERQQEMKMSPVMIFPMIALLIGLFWAFRLMWVYIPLSVLMPVDHYLKSLGGMFASVKMMVLYFCTMTPIMFITIMMSSLIFNVIGGSESGDSLARFIMMFVAVIAEMLVALVSTTAFVWAMKDFLPKEKDLLKDLPKMAGDK